MVLKIGFAVIFEGAENTRFSARITPQDADLRHEKYRKRGYKDPTGRTKADASGIYPENPESDNVIRFLFQRFQLLPDI